MLKMSNLARVLFCRQLRVRSLDRLCSSSVNAEPEPSDRPSSSSAEPSDSLDDKRVEKMVDMESILSSVNSPTFLKTSAVGHVISLSKLPVNQKNELLEDPRFTKLLKLLEKDMRTCHPYAIIGSLKALQNLGIPDDSYVVRNLENCLMWMTRTCHIKDLVIAFTFTNQRQETESQKKLFSEICVSLERRWVEINGGLFAPLLQNQGKLGPQLLTKLEDRIQDSVEDMSPADLVKILEAYSRTGRRNMPVIRSLGFHISKNRTFLDIKQIADVLFSFNKLSFKEQDTLERICYALDPLMSSNDNLAVVRSILISLGQLKFCPPVVLDMICDWYDKRLTEGKPVESRDITCLLLSLATLNYTPFDKEPFLQKLVGRLDRAEYLQLPGGDRIWVDVVWSLVVLKQAGAEHLASVLEPSFYTKLIESEETKFLAVKILNINAAAKLLTKDYKGPTINVAENSHLTDLHPPSSAQKTAFKKFVFETLSTLFPPPRFVSMDVKTGLGLTLDAEVVVDSNTKPLQVDQYSLKFGANKPTKELPNGAHRLALFITPFQESLIGGGMTGSTSLGVNLAQASGYKTLVIDHMTIDATMKTVSRVQKLDVLVKQAVGSRRT